jgi:hypothetical protein
MELEILAAVESGTAEMADGGPNMASAIELFVAVSCVIIGLSHLVRPVEWVEFFVSLREFGHRGVFANGMLSLTFGALIIGFHNVWQGWPVVITVFGWLQVLKGAISLLMPHLAIRSLARVSSERPNDFRIAGALFVILGLFSGVLACS